MSTFTDPASGRSYIVDPATGQSRWTDAAPVETPVVPVAPHRGGRAKERHPVRIALIVLGSLVGAFLLIGVIGVIVDGGNTKTTSASATTAAKVPQSHAPAAPGTPLTTPSAAHPAASAVGATPKPTAAVATTHKPLTAAQARTRAAGILAANVQHYRTMLQEGEGLAMQSGNSDFVTWRNGPEHPEQDVSYMDAFRKADQGFTAEDEPTSISTWQDDMANVGTDIGRWIGDAVSWRGGFGDIAMVQKDVAKMDADLNAADADIDRMLAGH